jgi:hypothetical protein
MEGRKGLGLSPHQNSPDDKKEHHFFSHFNSKAKAAEREVLTQVAEKAMEAEVENSSLRVSITIHSMSGVRLPLANAVLRNTKVYWSLRMLSANGEKNQRASTTPVSIAEQTDHTLHFEETFGFNLEYEGQVLQLTLKVWLCFPCFLFFLKKT